MTVTNSRTPDVTQRTVEKVWNDNNNQDGLRDAVTLRLVAKVEGVEIPWVTLKASAASGAAMDDDGLATIGPGAPLTFAFTNLPVKHLGKTVVYSVEETAGPAGYTASVAGMTVTNSRTPDVTSLTVEKIWDDSGVMDTLHTEVVLKLTATAGGSEIPWATLVAASASGPLMDDDGEVPLGPDAPLTHLFEHLPLNYLGKAITYTVDEPVLPPGYLNGIEGFTVTNTRELTPDISVRKIWEDQDDLYGLRPDSVIIHLTRSDSPAPYKSLELSAGNNWSGKFTNLPMKDGYGDLYAYHIHEDRVNAYLEPVYGEVQGVLTVTNTLDTIDVPVSKVFVDLDDLYGLRPESVFVQLLQNGAALVPDQVLELNDANLWQGKFTGLPRNDTADEPYLYTLFEAQATDYLPPQYAETEGVFTVTNTLDFIDIEVAKLWEDDDDKDRARPESITIRIMDGITKVMSQVVSGPGWTHLFENLPRTRAGVVIHYTVEEDPVPGYTLVPPTMSDFDEGAEMGTDTFLIELTNTHPVDRGLILISKVWVHGTNDDLPEAITIRIYDGATEVGVYELRDPWLLTVADLPRLRDGEPIVYTIGEDPVDGYDTAIDQVAFTITNTFAEPPVVPRDLLDYNMTIYNTGDSFH